MSKTAFVKHDLWFCEECLTIVDSTGPAEKCECGAVRTIIGWLEKEASQQE